MADILPPIPYDKPQTSFEWIDYWTKLTNLVNSGTEHNNLPGLQGGGGGNYYHLSQTQHNQLTGGGSTSLHIHEAFPIGSIYISVSSTNPATTLGYGTWTAFATGRVLVGLDLSDPDFDTVEKTGGSK